MKTLVTAFLLLGTLNAFAVPRGVYLSSPKKISIEGEQIKLTFSLACSNTNPEEWAGNLISLSNDEGDMELGVAMVFAKSSCTKGPKKDFSFTYPLSSIGIDAKSIKNGATIKPLDLAK